jgi:hypothetical protein
MEGEGGGHFWPGPPQLPVHRSQWKFIFPIGHISFRIRLDSMLKLIRNYINPIGLTVWAMGYLPRIMWANAIRIRRRIRKIRTKGRKIIRRGGI